MKLIPLDQIVVPEFRQRKEYPRDKMQTLIESIAEHGLFNALVLRVEGDSYVLAQGGRRHRALSELLALESSLRYDNEVLPKGLVPYVSLGDLDPLEREVVELEENIQREQLTWKEQAAATARISAIRSAQAERTGKPAPGTVAIAEEVRGADSGRALQDTRRELIIAQHLHDPDVAGAKSLDEGWKVLKRKEQAEHHRARAESAGKTHTSSLHAAYHAEALEWMRGHPAESFDVILTDPPYGMGADEFGDAGGKAQTHTYADSAATVMQLVNACPTEFFRLAKPEAHAYVFCDIDFFFVWRHFMEQAGWWVHRTPIVWHKPGTPRVPWPEHGPQRNYELILYAVKGKKRVTKIFSDVVTCQPDKNLGHPAQKPVELLKNLLTRSVLPGDSVLDPFAGSGSIFPAAHDLKCRATGIEMDAASYGIMLKRIEDLR
jgi:DNA modification methylase